MRCERQIDGIAKAKGVPFRAVKKLTPTQFVALRKKRTSDVLIKILLSEYQLSKASIDRYLASSEIA